MKSPAMTPDEIAEHPLAPVRINCRACRCPLFAGDQEPEGGAEAVFEAAGCRATQRTCPGASA